MTLYKTVQAGDSDIDLSTHTGKSKVCKQGVYRCTGNIVAVAQELPLEFRVRSVPNLTSYILSRTRWLTEKRSETKGS